MSSTIIKSFSQALKYMWYEEVKDVCMAEYLWSTLLNGQWDITVCKLVQAAINLGLKFRTTVVEQQAEKIFF